MFCCLVEIDLGVKCYCDCVVLVIQFWLEVVDCEMVCCGMILFLLLYMVFEGVCLMWGIVDVIWVVFGDMLQDYNWYLKWVILLGVYGLCVFYWLGDEMGGEVMIVFIDCWIDDVMQFEKFKGQMWVNFVIVFLVKGVECLLVGIKVFGILFIDLFGCWQDFYESDRNYCFWWF